MHCNENTITVWYDAVYNGNRIFQYGKEGLTITDTDINLIEKDRYSFNTEKWNSVILNHENWHTLYNNDESYNERILLQWRFKPGLNWKEILKITKKIHI
jgi:hypothetical protein